MADSTSPVMQSEEETLEQTTNATNEERTIGQEENVEATKDNVTLGSKPKRKKKSTVWQDFTEMKDADRVMKISCIHCERMYTKSKTTATTQLHRHLQSCANYLKAKADKSKDGLLQTQLGFVSSSVGPSAYPSLYVGKFDMEKMKESVAHWIMMHEHPFSIVEEEGFNLMQRRGMPKCLTTDCWKSKNQKIEYMVITGHWIDESWQLQKCVLNFVDIRPPCRGLEIANAIWRCLEDWGIESKIHTISMDNASAIDSAIDSLKRIGQKLRKVCSVLELFWTATHIISGSDYPTSNLFLNEVSRVKVLLDKKILENDMFIQDMVARMKVKFDKYWGETNLLMFIAAVLDPRCKLRAIEFCFPRLYSSENVERQIAIVRKTLYELYYEYVAISKLKASQLEKGKEINYRIQILQMLKLNVAGLSMLNI
ncbi:Zinc finger BED domain-containing protein RICESLEEPER 2 [Sesamum alatum]|uniref:Zinc finger BED domain-containing protein RICESLEEPER 2 n=1 Tax=Sesamum alatum TaxID=300844 RepID=A0AAE1Y1D8_9LAMI|nr:Zinc finger BED domain-containing protein RICESLEEPER 2 [Sesamum alatum]